MECQFVFSLGKANCLICVLPFYFYYFDLTQKLFILIGRAGEPNEETKEQVYVERKQTEKDLLFCEF